MPNKPRTILLAATLVAATGVWAFAASDKPSDAASPHTGFSAGMTPSAGTASGTRDGTTDTGATSPSSSNSNTYGSPPGAAAADPGAQTSPKK
jgi:hypothetical protein